MVKSEISKGAQAFADSYTKGYEAGTEHGLRLRAAEGTKEQQRQNGRLRHEIGKLKREIKALRELAQHLNFCRECGEMSVDHCSDGLELWNLASMPVRDAEGKTSEQGK